MRIVISLSEKATVFSITKLGEMLIKFREQNKDVIEGQTIWWE